MSDDLAGRVDTFNCSHLPYGWTVTAPICRTCVLALVQREVAAEVALDRERMNADWHGVMSMIAERLDALECLHGKDHGETPPLMYAEWIGCVVAASERRVWLEAARIAATFGSGPYDVVRITVQSIAAQLRHRAKDGPPRSREGRGLP